MIFHRHHWEILSASYTPPGAYNGELYFSPETGRRNAEGVTHIYLRCTQCGILKSRELLGRFQPENQPPDAELEALRKAAGL